jgi:hypothetical protein
MKGDIFCEDTKFVSENLEFDELEKENMESTAIEKQTSLEKQNSDPDHFFWSDFYKKIEKLMHFSYELNEPSNNISSTSKMYYYFSIFRFSYSYLTLIPFITSLERKKISFTKTNFRSSFTDLYIKEFSPEKKRISNKLKQIETKYRPPTFELPNPINSRPKAASNSQRRNTVNNIPKIKIFKKEQSKQNLSVFFGHENWNLILNMMIGDNHIRTLINFCFLGIRETIKKIYGIKINENDLNKEFQSKWKADLIKVRIKGFDFRKAYQFYDYCTVIFEKIRNNFGIEGENYLKSIGPEYLLVNFRTKKIQI